MADRDKILAALRKADANGDTASAQRFAAMLKQQPAEATPAADKPGYGGVMTAIHNFADTATFGLADHAAAGLSTVGEGVGHALGLDTFGITKPQQSYDQNLADIRGDAEQGSANNPTSALAGDAAGLFGGGGVISAGVRGARALPVVGRAAEALDTALTARRGQAVGNVARAAVTGAATGAADSAAHGGNADQDLAAGATGAVLGPIVGKVAGAVATRLAPAADRAMRLLSDKIGESPAVLQAAFANFRAATGRVPTMAELMGMRSRGELASVASENPTVGTALNNAATNAGSARPTALATRIEQEAGGPIQDASTLVQARDARMTAAMTPIRGQTVPVDHTAADLLNDPRVRNATASDPELRTTLHDAIQAINDTGQGHLTVDQIDSLRQSLRSRQAAFANPNNANHNSQVARQFGRIADEVSALADQHVPQYGHALNQYTQDQNYIDAFHHGHGGKTLGEADDPQLIRTLGTPEGQAGHASGVMSRLANRAGASEAGANTTALDLTQPGTLRAVSEAVGSRHAQRLAEAAAFERRSKDALNDLAPSSIQPNAQPNVIDAGHAVAGLAAHSPTTTAYHGSRLFNHIFGSKVKMSQAVQERAAQYLTDPNMTQQGIALLRRAGAEMADIRRFQTAVSAATGAQAGNVFGSGQ